MKQSRLSLGCRDWQQLVRTIGAEAAGILLYLRLLMRSMQSAELSIRIRELAEAAGVTPEQAESAVDTIVAGGYLTRSRDPFGVITLKSPEEARALADMQRKRASRALKKIFGQSGGQSGRSRTCTTEVRSAPPWFPDHRVRRGSRQRRRG